MKPGLTLLLLFSVVACAPSWPDEAALTASKKTGTSVELTWPRMDGVDTFRVMQGEKVLSEALAGNTTRFIAGGLDDGVAYTFAVEARAEGGRWSSPLRLEVSTPDVTAPRWKGPPQFRITVEAETEQDARLKLIWGDVEDNVGVERFLIHHRPAPPITVAPDVREHVVESAAPDGIWQLEAQDKAGNGSEVLAFNIETELTAARRENLKARGIQEFAERGGGGSADMFGPGGLGVPVDGAAVRPGKGPAAVRLAETGRAEARAFAASRLKELERCYLRAREVDSSLAGVVTVTLVVDAEGVVNPSRITGLKNANLRNCVRGGLMKGRLPKKPDAGFRTEVSIHMGSQQKTKSDGGG